MVLIVFFFFSLFPFVFIPQKLYNGVMAKKPSVEEANMLGARLIREAKVRWIVRFPYCAYPPPCLLRGVKSTTVRVN